MAGVLPNIFVEVELSGSGAGWTSLSADVLISEGIIIRRGILGSGPDDNVASTGSATFTLNNSDRNSGAKLGYYSLYHANKRSGFALGIGCRIRMQDPTTSTFYTRIIGRIDAIDPEPGSTNGEWRSVVTMVDWLDEAARWTLTEAVGEQVGQSGDQIMADILAAMPTQPTATSFDVGYETYPYALDSSAFATQSALNEFKKLANSERGLIFITMGGTLRYEGRHARMLDTVSDWTLADTDYDGLTLPSTRDEIINTVRVRIHPRIVDDLPTTIIYNQANVIEIAGGASQLLIGPYRDQITGDQIGATAVQALVATTDYTANTAAGGSGTDVTSSFSIALVTGASGARFTVTNGTGAVGYLTFLQLRGKAIKDNGTLQLQARDTTSITANGEHVVELDMPYQSSIDVGQGAANYNLSKYSTAFAQARTVSVIGKTTAILTQILSRDISDRLTIAETVTGLNSAFFINGEELQVRPDGHLAVTYILAPAADPFSGLYWVLGTSVLGTSTIPAPF